MKSKVLSRFKSAFRRRFYLRRFQSALGERGKAPRLLIAYLPTAQQGWILDFLWKDLCKELALFDGLRSGIASSPEDLWRQCQGQDVMVVAMGLKHLNELIEMGFPPYRIIYYHTHVRLGLQINKLDLLHGVLVLNGFERELIAMRKVDRDQIHLFPAGYDHNLFNTSATEKKRSIDVLFVGRYRQGQDGYYHQRKRYSFQVELANQLCERGLNVAFLGGDWTCCEYDLNSGIKIFQIPHNGYPEIYREARAVCSVAGQEGGPVSFLEGLASGCLMVAAPTGFISDLKLGDVACWTFPLIASAQDWADEIQHILQDHPAVSVEEQAAREKFLIEARFSSLAQKLVECCWPSC